MIHPLIKTTAEFEEEIRQMLEYQSSGFSTVAYHAYDAVWTLARAINRYNYQLTKCNALLIFTNFSQFVIKLEQYYDTQSLPLLFYE